MTFRLRWGRMLRFGGVAVVTLVVGLAVFVQVQQRILRWRAERLLDDMREMQSHKSTWADAQKIRTRWGAWGRYEGTCTAKQCDYYIRIQDSFSTFIQNHGERVPFLRFLAYPLVLVCERGDWVEARISVRDNDVTESGYDVVLIVPFASAREPSGGYGLVGIASQTIKGFDPYNFRTDRLLHPEYWIGAPGGCEGCIKLMTEFTPLAGREKIRELTDFNLSCLTNLLPCTTESDLMPSAWSQYQRELPSLQARRDAFDQCKVPLEFFGREYNNVAVAEIISLRPTPASYGPQLAVRMRVTQILKGKIPWPMGSAEDAMVYDRGPNTQRWNSTDLVAGQRYIMLAEIGKNESGKNVVAIDDCGVVPYTEQNLTAIQRGIDASLARKLPER